MAVAAELFQTPCNFDGGQQTAPNRTIFPMRSLIAMYDGEKERARAEHREFVEVIKAVEDDKLREMPARHYRVSGSTKMIAWSSVAFSSLSSAIKNGSS